MIKVALVDDHPVVRSGFSQLLALEEDIEICGEYSCVQEALDIPNNPCDIVICDISLPDGNGLELIPTISKHCSIIMLSVHDNPLMIEDSLQRGAKGYLSKRCGPDEMVTAVRSVYQGNTYLPPELAAQLKQNQSDNLCHLTKRERQICSLLVEGKKVTTIAEELGLSYKTVHVHRAHILDKMDVQNTVELSRKVLSTC